MFVAAPQLRSALCLWAWGVCFQFQSGLHGVAAGEGCMQRSCVGPTYVARWCRPPPGTEGTTVKQSMEGQRSVNLMVKLNKTPIHGCTWARMARYHRHARLASRTTELDWSAEPSSSG